MAETAVTNDPCCSPVSNAEKADEKSRYLEITATGKVEKGYQVKVGLADQRESGANLFRFRSKPKGDQDSWRHGSAYSSS